MASYCDEENNKHCYLFLKSDDRKAKNIVEAVNPRYCSKVLNEELQNMVVIVLLSILRLKKRSNSDYR